MAIMVKEHGYTVSDYYDLYPYERDLILGFYHEQQQKTADPGLVNPLSPEYMSNGM